MQTIELNRRTETVTRPIRDCLSLAAIRQSDRERIRNFQAGGGVLWLLYFEIGNFSFFSGIYGEDVAESVTSVVFDELGVLAAENALDKSGPLFIEPAGPGKFVVLCDGLEPDALPDLAMTFRLRLRSVVKGLVIKLTGQALDISAGYAILPGTSQGLEPALYAALCDAQQAMRGLIDGSKLGLLREFREIVDKPLLSVVYQPIVDLRAGQVFGWESLARGPRDSHFRSPSVLFDFAEEMGLVFALERVCREAAIQNLGPVDEGQRLFLNIHPRTLVDPDFSPGETLRLLKDAGLGPRNVVFEITERHSIRDFTLFHRTLEHYRGQGYLIAVDDVGTGYSGLQSIAEIRPDFIKIDMSLVRNIDTDPVKRALIETFVAFSDKIGCRMIAEGVETQTEMTSLMSMGVHFGQGYYLERPNLPKPGLEPRVVGQIAANSRRLGDEWKCSIPLSSLAEAAYEVDPATSVRDVKKILESYEPISAVVVVASRKPVGLVMSHHLDRALSSTYGMSLYYDKSVARLMDSQPLVAEGSTPVEIVARLAMNREKYKIYDYIIVTEKGEMRGIVSVQKMLDTLACVQVEMAKGANPLTGLPGNVAIEQELEQRSVSGRPVSFIYVDLDNFKAYNDTYGFKSGDNIILLMSKILAWAVKRHGNAEEDFLGHVGGDDYVVVTSPGRAERLCKAVTRVFGRLVRYHYTGEDRARGFISGKDRTGADRVFPLVSVSMAIIDCNGTCDFATIAQRSAEMKKYAKTIPGNSYVRDRRRGKAPPPPCTPLCPGN